MRTVAFLIWTEVKRLVRLPKYWIILLFTAFFVYDFLVIMKEYAANMQLGIAPYTYPLFISQWSSRIYVMLLIVVIMSDAPFKNGIELMAKLRISSYKWLMSKIAFIFLLSIIFQVIIILFTIIFSMPYVGFEMGWGDVIKAYSDEQIYMVDASGFIGESALLKINPITAMLYEIILMTLLISMIGLLILIINSVCKNYLGTIIIGVLTCMHTYLNDYKFYGKLTEAQDYVPISWIDLSRRIDNISSEKAMLIMLIVDIGLIALAFLLMKCKKICVLEEI